MENIVETGGRRLMIGRIYGLVSDKNKYVEIVEQDIHDLGETAIRVKVISFRSDVIDEGVGLIDVKDISQKPLGITEAEREALRKILRNRVKRSRKPSPFMLWGTPPMEQKDSE